MDFSIVKNSSSNHEKRKNQSKSVSNKQKEENSFRKKNVIKEVKLPKIFKYSADNNFYLKESKDINNLNQRSDDHKEIYYKYQECMDSIYKEFDYLKEMKLKLINMQDKHKIADMKNLNSSMDHINELNNKKLVSKSDFIPKINKSKKFLNNSTDNNTSSEELNLNCDDTFSRLYNNRQNCQQVSKEKEEQLNQSYHPNINSSSIEILKSNNKLYNHDELFEKNYREQSERVDKLQRVIEIINNEYDQKPKTNNNEHINWDWDKFIQNIKNKNKNKIKRGTSTFISDNTKFEKQDNYMSPASIKMLVDKSLIDVYRNPDLDIYRKTSRFKLYKITDNFHLRLFEPQFINDKLNKLEEQKIKLENKILKNKPSINKNSNEYSLKYVTELEQIKLQDRKSEREHQYNSKDNFQQPRVQKPKISFNHGENDVEKDIDKLKLNNILRKNAFKQVFKKKVFDKINSDKSTNQYRRFLF